MGSYISKLLTRFRHGTAALPLSAPSGISSTKVVKAFYYKTHMAKESFCPKLSIKVDQL